MADRRHLQTLLALEMRRAWPGARAIAGFVAIVVLVLLAAGKWRLEYLLPVCLGAALGTGMSQAFGVMRDKLERTLEFLSTLPTDPGTVVQAKFLTEALLMLPWCLGGAALIPAVGLPGDVGARLAHLAVGSLLFSWTLVCLIAWWTTAIWLRFDPETVGLLPGAGLVALLFAAGFLVERLPLVDQGVWPKAARWLVTTWWAVPASVLSLCVLATIGAGSAFVVARHALRRYQPRPDGAGATPACGPPTPEKRSPSSLDAADRGTAGPLGSP